MTETARNDIKSEAERAKNDSLLYVCSFDLQKALLLPTLSVSVAHYKRNMFCNNFGIKKISKYRGTFYVWKETEGKRGS